MYGESFSRNEQESLATYDMKTQTDGTIAGRTKGHWGCRWWSQWAFPYPEWRENQCVTEEQIVFSKVEPNRIEGYIFGPKAPTPNDRNFAGFCKSCGATSPKVKQPFVWVRID